MLKSAFDIVGCRVGLFLGFFFFFKQKTAYEISACLVGSEMCIRDRCFLHNLPTFAISEEKKEKLFFFVTGFERICCIFSNRLENQNLITGTQKIVSQATQAIFISIDNHRIRRFFTVFRLYSHQ